MVNLAGLKEYATISVMRTHSLARFGDGEIKLMHREDSKTQVWNKEIEAELWKIFVEPSALIAMPYVHPDSPRKEYWQKFLKDHPMKEGNHYSSFITRFDEAPWLDTPEYRNDIEMLWWGRDVVLVRGEGSLKGDDMRCAESVKQVIIPSRDAYPMTNAIESKVLREIDDESLVILCAGAVGTILANRLAGKGVHALDLGYIGRFL